MKLPAVELGSKPRFCSVLHRKDGRPRLLRPPSPASHLHLTLKLVLVHYISDPRGVKDAVDGKAFEMLKTKFNVHQQLSITSIFRRPACCSAPLTLSKPDNHSAAG